MILNNRKNELMLVALRSCTVIGCGLVMVASLSAQDALAPLQPLTVVGSRDAAFELPGSAAYEDAVEFRERGYTNIAQIAARVPGVYIRDEDGYGNFPNISLRGVDGSRSTKVTMMEDGILTAPAPYSAPNAYYAPKAARMSGIEFLKGSSQVKYGPQTTGGVVNYLSTLFPEEGGPSFYSRLTYGSHNTLFLHSWYGDTQDTKAGRVGYLLELHGESSDGYRKIDGSTQDTGFDLIEPMLKLFWEPDTALKQRVEFKVGYTRFDANESYTGLTDADADANPDRRYAASFNDRFDSDHWRTYLKWMAEPSDALRLESALYFNSFDRTWDKLSAVDLSATGSTITKVDESMVTADGLALLQGTGPGNVLYAGAFREHEAFGWQNQANIRFETGTLQHDLAVGLRLHHDQQDGTTTTTTYTSNGAGSFGQTAVSAPAPITRQEAFATAIYVEDAIAIDKLTLRPGVRYEYLDLESSPFGAASVSLDEQLLMAGLGANYEITDIHSAFGGVYRGMSPANPSGYSAGAESEESLGFELGLRHKQDSLRAELIGFFTDFDSLIAPELPGGAGTLPSQNGGSAEVWGVESLVEYDHAQANHWGFGLPVYASLTYTHAEFAHMGGVLANGAGTFAGGRNGNDIPYVPEWKLASGISFVREKWRVNLDASYLSSMWGTGYNGDPRAVGTNPSIIDGKIDSLLIFDLTGHYQLTDNVRLVGGIQNLFDERGAISRAPLGVRTNAPQTIFAGFEATF
jgi:Fe(3+) dicitrate transport protein